ncbi:MAG: CDP-diacylglycerol--serine O-phosphatidyltransferase [Bacteroidetes bacterium]|jgi:CDP-diacylglycerol--serine O-phosphatidyltransferase|nr:CDP-diacylglycerol--serine O-phosphatidyltransferase [Bacteroidota bacterium]
MKHIPNIITSLNLVAGFISIIFAFNGQLLTASWLILIAMVFDFFDGFSARLLQAYSPIGKELDSLADAVSFGVAPAIIIYQLLGYSMGFGYPFIENTISPSETAILLSPVIMCLCAVLRLAVFNIDDTQVRSFRGLPTPASALAVISLVIATNYADISLLTQLTESTIFLIILTVILALLMISRIPLISLKTNNLKLKGNEARYLLIILILSSIVFLGIGAAPLIIPFYLLSSALSLLLR